jgi:hypothetical protein
MVMNPNGRAILKSCDYVKPAEMIDDEYPLGLSTGRAVYQFHSAMRARPSRRAVLSAASQLDRRRDASSASRKRAPKRSSPSPVPTRRSMRDCLCHGYRA